ncbi:hypothetical protein [Cellvibrio japonicus]|uniref:hypothetical protein n=1 Tax=Cellvibrio japonicus TaxID=155077 RepID=UPI0005A2D063|nr:hypothetical protein [Cellvibrio japonicus]QEI11002.1 hypothetical protein FY117_01325 [Cellvibrio japonicus]QEI14577.1 hypothetical protein FY116_01325 [Cellvibrio japonicus]QEI18156.1 hypothetical protein FY115_01325 [Cellvibrio japonicus]
MNTFGLDRNYEQFNFEEVSVEDLQIISGGSGGGYGTDSSYWAMLGMSTAFVIGAATVAAGPVAWGFVAGSLILSGGATYHALGWG